jgi:hypothetical protein
MNFFCLFMLFIYPRESYSQIFNLFALAPVSSSCFMQTPGLYSSNYIILNATGVEANCVEYSATLNWVLSLHYPTVVSVKLCNYGILQVSVSTATSGSGDYCSNYNLNPGDDPVGFLPNQDNIGCDRGIMITPFVNNENIFNGNSTFKPSAESLFVIVRGQTEWNAEQILEFPTKQGCSSQAVSGSAGNAYYTGMIGICFGSNFEISTSYDIEVGIHGYGAQSFSNTIPSLDYPIPNYIYCGCAEGGFDYGCLGYLITNTNSTINLW